MGTSGYYPDQPAVPSGHVKLPRGWSAREFHLNISWSPDGSIRERRGDVPGFYLQAMFANEGEAFPALPGHGWKDEVLLGAQTLRNVLVTLASDANVPSVLMNLGAPLGDAVEEAQRARVVSLVQAKRRAEEQLEATRAALRAEGLDPDGV